MFWAVLGLVAVLALCVASEVYALTCSTFIPTSCSFEVECSWLTLATREFQADTFWGAVLSLAVVFAVSWTRVSQREGDSTSKLPILCREQVRVPG